MARNAPVIDVLPQRVFAVLADGCGDGQWVVGSSEVSDVDEGFPEAGTRFRHSVGFGPLKIADRTRIDVRGRNVESLRRLKEPAEGRGPSMRLAAASRSRSSTSTARSWTRTTSTRWRGFARCATMG